MKPKGLVFKTATRHGNLPAVRALLQSGVNPDDDGLLLEAGNKQICTALHIAAGAGHLGVAKALIEAGADVNKQELDDLGRTPLMLAAAAGHTPVIMELIRAGANVNTVTRFSPNRPDAITALMVAVLNGHEACVLALIYAGADVYCLGHRWELLTQSNQTASAGAKRNIVELIRYAASRNFLVLELDSV
jgi:ankyrin repeat protein